jgi:hypothetical protein
LLTVCLVAILGALLVSRGSTSDGADWHSRTGAAAVEAVGGGEVDGRAERSVLMDGPLAGATLFSRFVGRRQPMRPDRHVQLMESYRKKCSGRFDSLVVGILLPLLGVAFLAVGVPMLLNENSMLARFLPVAATVVQSRNRSEQRRSRDAQQREVIYAVDVPQIVCSYRVRGREVRGGRVFPTEETVDYGKGPSLISRYPVGASTVIYYNPDDPTDAFLIKRSSIAPRILAGVGVAMFSGGLLFYGMRLRRKRSSPTDWGFWRRGELWAWASPKQSKMSPSIMTRSTREKNERKK